MPPTKSHGSRSKKGKPERKPVTDARIDSIVAEATRGVMVSDTGKKITYYRVANRTAGSHGPSLRGLADVVLPAPEQRDRERKRTRRLLARARAEERKLGLTPED